MKTVSKDQATMTQKAVHKLLQQRFNQHRHKFDRHRQRGPLFAAAVDELEKHLFG
jgi:hypothetical protein